VGEIDGIKTFVRDLGPAASAPLPGHGLRLMPSIPTMVHHTGHTFVVLRSIFLSWAEQHDPDAAAVFVMGDTRLDQLLQHLLAVLREGHGGAHVAAGFRHL
jgi:hypothetical protein